MAQQAPSSRAKKSVKEDVPMPQTHGARVLKKYPNRRLYDTQSSSYITLEDVKRMVMSGHRFVVLDAKTHEDLTRSILLQIILEQEAVGAPMFSSQTLAQIIRFYGHSMQNMMGSYLERNLQIFSDMQQHITDQAKTPSPERWTQLLDLQPHGMPGFMTNYLEQSKLMLAQAQERFGRQTESLFSGLTSHLHPPQAPVEEAPPPAPPPRSKTSTPSAKTKSVKGKIK
jgi:polyhydroxyalkanoate synthesis repressor PhaR